jgi:hypothetical protein
MFASDLYFVEDESAVAQANLPRSLAFMVGAGAR